MGRKKLWKMNVLVIAMREALGTVLKKMEKRLYELVVRELKSTRIFRRVLENWGRFAVTQTPVENSCGTNN